LPWLQKAQTIRYVCHLPSDDVPHSFLRTILQPHCNNLGKTRWAAIGSRLVRIRSDPPIDITDYVEELQEEFQSQHDRIVSNLAKVFQNRVAAVDALHASSNATPSTLPPPQLQVDLLRGMATHPVLLAVQKHRSARVCGGCPVVIVDRVVAKRGTAAAEAIPPLPARPPFTARISGSELVLEGKQKTKTIAISDVELFVRHDDIHGEIFTADQRSYFVLAPKKMMCFEKLPQSAIPPKWTSTFDFLIALNRLSGRSFNDPAHYPIFPVVVRSGNEVVLVRSDVFSEPVRVESLPDLEKGLANVAFVAPEAYSLPEYILRKPRWARTQYEFVYEMRRMLEMDVRLDSLREWIGKMWVAGTALRGISHRAFLSACPTRLEPVSKSRDKIVRQLGQAELAFAWVADGRLGTISRSSNLAVFSLTNNDLPVISKAKLAHDSICCDYYTLNGALMVYDRYEKTLLKTGETEEIVIEIESRLFAEFGATFLYCPNPFEVWRFGKMLCFSDCRIVALAASWIFQVFVFTTADRKVHFHCARKGVEITSPTETSELVHHILITEKCGYVLMHSKNTIYLYSVNGGKIKEVPLSSPILFWSTFSSCTGLDYVIYTNSLQDIAAFDAFYPEHIEIICRSPNVIFIHVDPTCHRVLCLSLTQDFILISHRFPGGLSRRRYC
jgi:hypothetical protein